jgi:hypothetical protein
VSEEPATAVGAEDEMVELAKAHDRFEAGIWARNLDQMGIQTRLENRAGLIRKILYLWRVPVHVLVQRKDHARALEFLTKFRFI